MKEKVKKIKFLTTIITLIILLIGAIAVPAYAEEIPLNHVKKIDLPNVLLVGKYGFDLMDQENNNYNFGNFMEAAQTTYRNPGTGKLEVYWFTGTRWYDLVSDEFLDNPIGDLDSINGDGLYSYGNTIAGYWLNQAIIKAIKDVNAAGDMGAMRTALEENKAVLVPEGKIYDLMAAALLEKKGEGYSVIADILSALDDGINQYIFDVNRIEGEGNMRDKLLLLNCDNYDALSDVQQTEVAKLFIIKRSTSGYSSLVAIEEALEQAIGEYDGLLAAVNNATDTASMKTALQAIGGLFRITVNDQMAGAALEGKPAGGYQSVSDIIAVLLGSEGQFVKEVNETNDPGEMRYKLLQLNCGEYDALTEVQQEEVAKLLIIDRPIGGFSSVADIEAALCGLEAGAVAKYKSLLAAVNAADNATAMSGALEELAEYFENVDYESSLKVNAVLFAKGAADYQSVARIIEVQQSAGITWPSAASELTYGQKLSESALTGGKVTVGEAELHGTFGFEDPDSELGAGEHEVGVKFVPSETKYAAITGGTVNVTVHKDTPVVETWPTSSKLTYGQKLKESTLIGGIANIPGKFAFSDGEVIPPAGNYEAAITFTPEDSANYNIITSNINVRVEQRPLTITAVNKSKVYGDPDPALEYVITEGELVEGDELEGELERVAGEDVGTYAITQGTLAASGNYTINFVEGVFTITPKTITVIADNKTKFYGDPDPALTYTVSGLVGEDQLTGALGRVAGEDVGEYDITQGTLAASGNYTINFVEGVFTITPKTITVIADNKTKFYGDPDPALTYTVSGLVGEDQLTGALGRVAGEDVGEYDINQGTLSDTSGNYTITFVKGTFTITPKTITVTAYDKTKIYGEPDPELTYTVSELVGEDQLSGELERVAGEDVGTYAITQGTLTAGANYEISFVGADFTIEPRALEIKVTNDNLSKTYGDPDPEFTYEISSGSLVGDDTLSGELGREEGEDVKEGGYELNIGSVTAGGNEGKNYSISLDKEYTFTINPFQLTQANLDTLPSTEPITYGDTLEKSALYGGKVKFKGEEVEGTFEFDDPNIEPSEIGEYSATVKFVPVSNNYLSFTFNVTVKVNEKGLESVAITGNAVVGETLSANVLPVGATVNYQWQRAETEDGTFEDIPGATSATYDLVVADAGKYIRVIATGKGNYTGTVESEAVGPVLIYGTIERDPANTGGDLGYGIVGDTVTFTSGPIKWYPEDDDLKRPAGNRVGVQINAPAGFDTTNVTVTIGENTYNWEDIKDGDNYFWWYPLVTVAGQEFTAKVKWNESSEQTFKVVIGSNVGLEENILEGYVVKVGENGLGVDAAKFLNAVAKWDGSTLEYDNGSIIFRGSPDKDAYGRKSGLYVSKVAPLKERTFATTGEAYVSLTNDENTYYVVFDAAAVSGLNDGRTSKYLCGIPAPGTGYDEAVELAGVEGYVFDFFFGQDKAAAYLEREDTETSYYPSIQAAIDDATEGNNTIKVLPGDHGTGPIQIIQKEDVNITLEAVDEAEVVLKNQIQIDGAARADGQESLTIKGFTFDFSGAENNIIVTSKLDESSTNLIYAHNVTIEDCKFIGNPAADVVAVAAGSPGGHRNFVIRNCTGENIHSLGQLRVNGVTVEKCYVSASEGGLNLQNSTGIQITNLTVNAQDYGVRAGQSSGTVNQSNTMTISNSSLTAEYPIWLRGDAPGTVIITNSELNPSSVGKMIRNDAGDEVTIIIDGAYYVATEAKLRALLADTNVKAIIIGEDIVLNKHINLNNNAGLVIDGYGNTINVKYDYTNRCGFYLGSNGITVKNLTITGDSGVVGIDTVRDIGGFAVENVAFKDIGIGFYANPGVEGTIQNCIFEGLGIGVGIHNAKLTITGNGFENINKYLEIFGEVYTDEELDEILSGNIFDVPVKVVEQAGAIVIVKDEGSDNQEPLLQERLLFEEEDGAGDGAMPGSSGNEDAANEEVEEEEGPEETGLTSEGPADGEDEGDEDDQGDTGEDTDNGTEGDGEATGGEDPAEE